jgi:tRNA U34 5-methylaminomethyl-2-thiouridine-forming methyltransferase MnmC
MDSLKLIISEDGSHTLYNAALDETYHSIHGAKQESNFVFIQTGLEYFLELYPNTTIKVLEIGFGTGLNALLTAIWAEKKSVKVEYTTLETFPLGKEITQNLNFTQDKELENHVELLQHLHDCSWEEAHELNPFFSIQKAEKGIQEFNQGSYNMIFFDAFAPSKQEELWTLDIFKNIASLTEINGVFVTYCAKGQVRRDLQSVGFETQRLPGPPGKREMLRAILKDKK